MRLFITLIIALLALLQGGAQETSASLVTSSAVADAGSEQASIELRDVEPETVNEPTLRLDEPQAERPTIDLLPLVAFLCSVVAIIMSALALTGQRRLRKELAVSQQHEPTEAAAASGDARLEPAPAVITSRHAPQQRREPSRSTVAARVERQPQPAPVEVSGQRLFLSRPDEDDCFSRATAEFERGNSLFVLTTLDGVNGTFTVIDDKDVHRVALMMPTQNLTRACSGNAIQTSVGKSRIVTDRPGKASLENGRWHISLKAIIHYE